MPAARLGQSNQVLWYPDVWVLGVWHNEGVPSSRNSEPTGTRHGELTNLMRAGYHRTMEYVQGRLEQRGFDDVRPAHMMIFQHLRPEGSRIGELAERALLTNQSVGYLVDYLERQGYVERRADPTNRRASLVCLTDRGWHEMAACAGILDELDAELAERLGAQRLEQLHDLLVELTTALHPRK
jgi:DNA-binding MarR family transcriptional regulator